MIKHNMKSIEMPTFREAKIPHMFENIRVVVGSEETIFEEVYVTAVVGKDRIAKFKKSAVQYK